MAAALPPMGVTAAPAQRFSRVAVFCGSSLGVRPEYATAAEALGAELARRKIGLVYGGGSVGLMGAVSNAVRSAGGSVLGVIPRDLAPVEISGAAAEDTRGSCEAARSSVPSTLRLTASPPLARLRAVVEDMHSRKATMAGLADAFVALPGGYGTFEELLEAVTWQQLGYSARPCGLLNACGFWGTSAERERGAAPPTHLLPAHAVCALLLTLLVKMFIDPFLAFVDHAVAEGFIRPAARGILVVADTPAALLDALERYQAPTSLIALKLAEANAVADKFV